MSKVKLVAIAAVSVDGVIGINSEIPWKIPEDFKHFRETTMGHTILVGYKTYLSLPKKAFEGRNYIVLNNDDSTICMLENVTMVNTIESAMELIDSLDVEKVFIAGGESIYNQLVEHCDEAIITWVNKCYPKGNKFFPVDKLLYNLESETNMDWTRSKNDILYKIEYYKSIN